MDEDQEQHDDTDEVPPTGLVAKVWSYVDKVRHNRVLAGALLGLLTLGTIAGWLVTAQLAAEPDLVSVEDALEALDRGEDDLARAMIDQIQQQGTLIRGEFGGPLFVLGALKTHEAERQWSDERRRNDYRVASKYLNEANTIGFPESRRTEGLMLLGKSLVGSRQLQHGIEILQKALEAGATKTDETHLMLAQAYFYAPVPQYDKAIEELDQVITDPQTSVTTFDEAHMLRAEALAILGKDQEAEVSIQATSAEADPARRELILGKAQMRHFEAQISSGATPESSRALADKAARHLKNARRLDKLATSVSRQSEYLLARRLLLLGDTEAALTTFIELRRVHGSTPEGASASLNEGDLYQAQGKPDEALSAYRRALDSLRNGPAYRSSLRPLSALRNQLRSAHGRFLEDREFARALALTEQMASLFKQRPYLDMRAQTLRSWGDALLETSEDLQQPEHLGEARQRFRQAGLAFEQLAEANFATRSFVNHLWNAAEAYFDGQSYQSVIRVLERYLRNEPQQRGALALLRLGEAHLARNDLPLAIANLEECIEFHPTDASSYRARLKCAKAYRLSGEADRAESLLRDNLLRTAMSPTSPEWRDSLFELGRLMVEADRHEEAINSLGEAVDRYPEDDQSREGRYLIAESHRQAAREPLERLASTEHVTKREQAREEANRHLELANTEYLTVQNQLKLLGSDDLLSRAMLRNCYVMRGEVLFEMQRYEDAVRAYSVAGALYQTEPFVLETLVQTSHCWRRLNDIVRSRGAIEQAKLFLTQLPEGADFATSTNLTRAEWAELLNQLSQF